MIPAQMSLFSDCAERNFPHELNSDRTNFQVLQSCVAHHPSVDPQRVHKKDSGHIPERIEDTSQMLQVTESITEQVADRTTDLETTSMLGENEEKLPQNIISFPKRKAPPRNHRKGEKQTVFPIKRKEDREAMARWLYENKDPKYFLGFTLGINLGLRINELLNLEYSDLFTDDGNLRYEEADLTDTTDRIRVYQNKTGKYRELYLNQACASVLRWYFRGRNKYKNNSFIFPSREGGHIEPDRFRKVLKEAASACGIRQNIGTHSLRKTFGYLHFMENHDIVFLQRLFGHSSALITMRYIGIAEEEEKKAYHDVSVDFVSALGLTD